jgi:hypothetical protein
MVKEKFTLTGTDNDGRRHRYSVRKNELFKKSFLKFMEDLGFNPEIIGKTFWSSDEETGECIELKISEFEDCIRHYQNKKFDVDVFFGKLKIILVVRTKSREKMVDHLEKKASWIKKSEVKKIREKNKSRLKPQKLVQRGK